MEPLKLKRKEILNSLEKNKKLLKQIMEDLNLFLEFFINEAETQLIRSKLRLLHQNLEKGPLKKLVRGLLGFLNRWPRKKVLLRLSTILEIYTKATNQRTLKKFRIIENNRFTDHAAILTLWNNEGAHSIKNEQINQNS